MSEEGVGASVVGFSLVPFSWLFGDLAHPWDWLSSIPKSRAVPVHCTTIGRSRNPAWLLQGALTGMVSQALIRSHGVMDAASAKVVCPCRSGIRWDQGPGMWLVASGVAGTLQAVGSVMEQGFLSLPGAACDPRQVIPSLFMLSPWPN